MMDQDIKKNRLENIKKKFSRKNKDKKEIQPETKEENK